MKTILPAIALAAGLAGCSGKNESPDVQQQIQVATSACMNVTQELMMSKGGELNPPIGGEIREIIIRRLSSDTINAVTSLGIAGRYGEQHYTAIEVSPNSAIKSQIATILTTGELAGCIVNTNDSSKSKPLFFVRNTTPSEQLANALNGEPFNEISETPAK